MSRAGAGTLTEILATTPLANQHLAEIEILDTGKNPFVVKVNSAFSVVQLIAVVFRKSITSSYCFVSLWLYLHQTNLYKDHVLLITVLTSLHQHG